MPLRRLCFLLPSELHDDIGHPIEDHVSTGKQSPQHRSRSRGCGGQLLSVLRRLLTRFHDLKPRGFCHMSCHPLAKHHSSSDAFHDMDGVHVPDKVVAGNNPRIFSFSELYIGTKGFCEDEVLGSGGFGRVYRAVLPSDGTVVAVKCVTEKGEMYEKTFVAELMAVAQLRHRNLVRLRGWCVHEEQLLLVYDYMPNRSLDRILFRRQENQNAVLLGWERRRRIVRGLAAALYYLHEQLETQIIHRDVKTSNVMLDSHYNARLGDFGLARWLEHELVIHTKTESMRHHQFQFRLADTTKIGGTIGYLPPESFQKRSTTSAKSDVFSFGIVVLEVASGRRAVDLAYPDDQIILLDWIRRLSDEGKLLQAGDNRLPDGSYSLSDMERLVHLGLLCTLHDPNSRPNMKWIVETLSSQSSTALPALPSFQSHPLYISLSSPSQTGTDTTSTTTTTTTTTVTSPLFYSSNYLTATGETIYATAEDGRDYEIGGGGGSSRRQSSIFPMVQTPQEIPYKELAAATNNFSESRRVAELDFGTAYYGFLDNRHHVLVKRLGMKTCPALRARFCSELQNLGSLRHRNLVQLHGWCTEQGEMLVVYDYLSNRLLSHLLFHFHHNNESKQLRSALPWRHRYKIIKSLASAVLYLHEEWDEQVIHRNITSSAIIIDADMNPRLSSFALAEFLARNEHGHHHVITDPNRSVKGIFGYISPEYMESGEATPMADVYSFGVVVLEVVTGEVAVDFRWPSALLVQRVREFAGRRKPVEEMADPRLDGEYDKEELVRLIKLGMACTRSKPELRPSMGQIVSILDGNDEFFMEERKTFKERSEEWKQRNALSLSLIKRIQALGIQ